MHNTKAPDCLTSYYRCPEGQIRLERSKVPNGRKGYFRFAETTCYGMLDNCETAETPEDELPDASECVAFEDGAVRLNFDPLEAAESLRSESYTSNSQNEAFSVAAAAYYLIRPLLPVAVRKHLQRFRLRGWQKLSFPKWPVDHSVDDLIESLMLLALRASGAQRIPFIWFWPEGHSSCAIVTHDVETAKGRDYCSTLMDIDDSFGIKSSFQVVPEKRYDVTPAFLQSIRRRGCEVVVHDLNHDGNLFKNHQQFLERAKSINAYGQKYKADGFRAAVLYRKQQWYSALKFSYDMSVPNVARLDPQRGGCCTVMPYFIGDLLEIPVTMVQDYTLFNILNRYSIDLWREQIGIVMGKHGLMSFIVHPDFINKPRERKVYESLLEFLCTLRMDRGIWMTTPGEVNRWWRQRHGMRLVKECGAWEIEGAGKERARIAYASEKDGRLVLTLEEGATVSSSRSEQSREFASKI
jgi:hypothetical protein